MIPRRFSVWAKYLEYRLKGKEGLPDLKEMLYFLVQPSERRRGARFVERIEPAQEGLLRVWLAGYSLPIYYRVDMCWTSFCATLDETFNPKNWHYYQTRETPVSPEDVVVDCGCAEGLFAFATAPTVKRVIAFEPLPRFLDLLYKTFSSAQNVEIRPQALGNQPGMLCFTDQGVRSQACDDGDINVVVTTLDEALENNRDRVAFIKADVEGAEMEMLEGAKETIKDHRPKIAVAAYHPENDAGEMCRYLAGIHADYRFHMRGIAANGNPVMLHAW